MSGKTAFLCLALLALPVVHHASAQTKTTQVPSAVKPRLELARRALDLEKQGKYHQALELLERLNDNDFVIPEQYGIRDEIAEGVFDVEWEPAYPIGSRLAAMMRCYLELHSPRKAVPLAWHALEAGTADDSVFACIARYADLEGGFPQVETRLNRLRDEPKVRPDVERCLKFAQVEQDLRNDDWSALIDRIRTGSSERTSETLHILKFREFVVATLLRRSDEAVPRLIEALDPVGQTNWIVYALGRSNDERAIKPLFEHLQALKNYYERDEALEALSRLGEKAAVFAVERLTSDDVAVRRNAAEVLSKQSPDAVETADPGLKQCLALLRTTKDPQIPMFLLDVVAQTRNPVYLPEIRRIKEQVGSFGKFGDLNYTYTRAFLGDASVVQQLMEKLDQFSTAWANQLLEAATGQHFRTKEHWRKWWTEKQSVD